MLQLLLDLLFELEVEFVDWRLVLTHLNSKVARNSSLCAQDSLPVEVFVADGGAGSGAVFCSHFGLVGFLATDVAAVVKSRILDGFFFGGYFVYGIFERMNLFWLLGRYMYQDRHLRRCSHLVRLISKHHRHHLYFYYGFMVYNNFSSCLK